jgi:hypothetical protein
VSFSRGHFVFKMDFLGVGSLQWHETINPTKSDVREARDPDRTEAGAFRSNHSTDRCGSMAPPVPY